MTLTWFGNASVEILIFVEYLGSGFSSFLEFRGGIIGTGWSALPLFLLENMISNQNSHDGKLYSAIFKRRIVGDGRYCSGCSGSCMAIAERRWRLQCVGSNSEI